MGQMGILEQLANVSYDTVKITGLFSSNNALSEAFKNNNGDEFRDEIAQGQYLAHFVDVAVENL